jgi:transposase-like protein
MNKHYTREDKIAILCLLRDHDYNYPVVAKLTKVTPKTLSAWNDKLGDKIADDNNLPTIIAHAKVDIQVKRNEVIERAFPVIEMITDRMKKLIPKCKRMDHLAQAYKILNEATVNPAHVNIQNTQINIIDQLNERLKN